MSKQNQTILLGAFVGGAVAAGVNKYAPIENQMLKNAIPLGIGFVLGSGAKAKPLMVGVGAGMVGSGANLLVTGFLSGNTGIGEAADMIPESIFVENMNGSDLLESDQMSLLNGPAAFDTTVAGPQSFEASVASNLFQNEMPF
jgi:hypothetical protein